MVSIIFLRKQNNVVSVKRKKLAARQELFIQIYSGIKKINATFSKEEQQRRKYVSPHKFARVLRTAKSA